MCGCALPVHVRMIAFFMQVLRFTHWLPEKAEYKCSFRSSSSNIGSAAGAGGGGTAGSSSSGFDAPPSVTAPPSGPSGADVECMVGFEPCALGEAVRDVLLLSSATAGVYEVPLMGQCVPPKPQGPIDVSKVRADQQCMCEGLLACDTWLQRTV